MSAHRRTRRVSARRVSDELGFRPKASASSRRPYKGTRLRTALGGASMRWPGACRRGRSESIQPPARPGRAGGVVRGNGRRDSVGHVTVRPKRRLGCAARVGGRPSPVMPTLLSLPPMGAVTDELAESPRGTPKTASLTHLRRRAWSAGDRDPSPRAPSSDPLSNRPGDSCHARRPPVSRW